MLYADGRKLSEIIQYFDHIEISGSTDRNISFATFDSRECITGSLFIAVPGTKADGHDFISKAVETGASAVICERFPANISDFDDVTFIKVKNSRDAMARIAAAWYDFPSKGLTIAGVTGTNGKTTVTFLLRSIFDAAGIKAGIIGTTGIYLGNDFLSATHTTPDPFTVNSLFGKMKNDNIEAVAIEVSSHALDQHRVDAVNFDAAIFTNLTHEHLDYHSSREEYLAAKRRLFEMLDENTVAVVNADDAKHVEILEGCRAKKKILTGRGDNAAVRIKNEHLGIDYSTFELHFKDENKVLKLKTGLPGRFNIDNCASAAAAAYYLGIYPEEIEVGIRRSGGAPGRMQRINLDSGAVGIVDYAHTPDALQKALTACRDILESSQRGGKLICVFGCGGDRDKSKRGIMGKFASEIADLCIITSDNPRTEDPDKIIDQIYRGIENEEKKRTVQITNRDEAINYAVSTAGEGDIILVAGKGHEEYQIIDETRHHFSDAEELKRYGIKK